MHRRDHQLLVMSLGPKTQSSTPPATHGEG
jgi:hypothetical protein